MMNLISALLLFAASSEVAATNSLFSPVDQDIVPGANDTSNKRNHVRERVDKLAKKKVAPVPASKILQRRLNKKHSRSDQSFAEPSGKDQNKRTPLSRADSLTQGNNENESSLREKGGARNLKKSKKRSSSKSSSKSKGGGRETSCTVYIDNLTAYQWFSDIFWMVHSRKIVSDLFEFNEPAFSDLAKLAQEGDTDDLIDFYEDYDKGVFDLDDVSGPLKDGDSIHFDIDFTDTYDRLTLATSFIFSNDGFIAINGEKIKDGAVFYLEGLDAGVEANSQLCWAVQASSKDFPENSDCADVDRDLADDNDNSFPGEGFVHIHRGVHGLSDGDIEELLEFQCDDLDADSFVEYFSSLGYDDDELLYDDDKNKNERDDDSFLDFVEDNSDKYGDITIFEIALDAGDFDDFCDELEDIEDFLDDALDNLEPEIFDWRNPMARVEIEC